MEDDAERIRALRCISEKYSGADMDKFDAMVEKYAKAAHVIRIDVEQITGKELDGQIRPVHIMDKEGLE